MFVELTFDNCASKWFWMVDSDQVALDGSTTTTIVCGTFFHNKVGCRVFYEFSLIPTIDSLRIFPQTACVYKRSLVVVKMHCSSVG
jgi:hypothetical protein